MTRQPNILFIQSDQHNPKVMGCAGDPVVETPNLDALASRGIVFENAYCASPICVPSRSSMLTGQHPHENRVWTNSHVLSSSVPTFAHALGAAGYRTVQIGRMHFVGPDQLHGFSERYVGDHGPNYIGGNPADHGELSGTAGPHRVSLKKSGHGQSGYEVHDEAVADEAVRFIESLSESRESGDERPVLLAVGLMLPHQPFVARKNDYDRYEGKIGLPEIPDASVVEEHPYFQWWRSHTDINDVSDEESVRARTAYWALVDRLDAQIGAILNALEAAGLTEDTLVVYTADHGEQIGERGLWWKQTFFEESVKVPAIVSWPGRIPEEARSDRVITQFDLNATMIEAGAAPHLPFSHGRSLLELAQSPSETDWDDIAISEYCTEPGDPAHSDGDRTWQQRMVRRGDWKLMYFHGMPPLLFNLKDDPNELNNLAESPEHSSVLNELTDIVLRSWDPDQIDAEIRRMAQEQDLLTSWAARTAPVDSFRWHLDPKFDYLDSTQ